MRRKAFTLIELLVVVAIIAMLVAILLPSLARAREISKRTICGKNLHGIGQSMHSYASETSSSGMFPIPPYKTPQPPPAAGTSAVSYVAQVGVNRTAISTGGTDGSASVSVTRCFWMLMRAKKAALTAKIVNCPSSDAVPNTDVEPEKYFDFGTKDTKDDAYKQISYGLQVPFGTRGRGATERDIAMPLAADKGWVGAWKESGGGGSDQSTLLGTITTGSIASVFPPLNSPNHGGVAAGEGQNVLYGDSHVAFENRPIVGLGFDNIYTRWSAAPTAGVPMPNIDARVRGSVPGDIAPYADQDSLIYP